MTENDSIVEFQVIQDINPLPASADYKSALAVASIYAYPNEPGGINNLTNGLRLVPPPGF